MTPTSRPRTRWSARPAQRCWIEHEQVSQQPTPQGNLNVPGAAIGAVIGGILGHQVGGGSGQQIATVGGAVGGAALGAQYGRGNSSGPVTHDVKRCDGNPAQATPSYWDVTYEFHGLQHHVQMATAPGRTIVGQPQRRTARLRLRLPAPKSKKQFPPAERNHEHPHRPHLHARRVPHRRVRLRRAQ